MLNRTSTMHSTQLRGLHTGWLESGDSAHPLILFLHGYPDSPDGWEFQRDYFSERFRVICPFTRGANPSEPTARWQRYSHDSTALDLLQLIHRVQKNPSAPIVVVGHDMGAVQAWNLAEYLGPRLAALIIINGVSIQQMMARFGNARQHFRSWYIYGFQIPGLADLWTRYKPDLILNLAYGKGRLPRDKRPHFSSTKSYAKDHVSNPIRQYRAFVRDLPKMWRREKNKIQKPVLVLWGKHDPFLLTPTQEEIEPYAADLTMRILEGGHWPHRENALEVNRLIEQFLDRTRISHVSRPI